jgi:DNA-binding NarL/FixJ family response regulator
MGAKINFGSDSETDGAFTQLLRQRLSKTELLILTLLSDGSNNIEVGRKIGLSPTTIKTHRRNLLRKLDAANSCVLVYRAFQLGVIAVIDGQIVCPGLASLIEARSASKSKA